MIFITSKQLEVEKNYGKKTKKIKSGRSWR